MGKDSPSPPAAPDYAGAAQAQGAANVEAARLSARMANPNIIGPYGSQSVSYDGDQPTVTQTLTPSAQATLDAQQRVQRSLAGLGEQGIGTAQKVLGTPFSFGGPAIQTSLGNAGQIPQTPDLSRYGQASGLQGGQTPPGWEDVVAQGGQIGPRNRNLGGGTQPSNLGGDVDFSSLFAELNAKRGSSVGPQPFNQPRGNLAQAPQAPELSAYGMAGAGPSAGQYGFAQGGLNTSNVAAMPVNAGMTAQQAIMSRLDPSIARNRVSTETQLINQGLRPGGEAYNNAINLLGQQENDQRTQAVLQGIGLDTAANAQGFGQALQAGQYGNQAVAQNFGLGQAANASQNAAVGQNQQAALAQYQAQLGGQQQGFGQQVTQRQLGNQAISQNQQTALAQQQAAMGAQNQQFNQGLAGAQFANTAQQNALAQALQGRQMPLNEITALMSGSQIQNPTFQPYQGQSVAPAPVAQAAAQQAQFGQNIYNQQMGQANANTAGLYSLGGAFLGGPAGAKAGSFLGNLMR